MKKLLIPVVGMAAALVLGIAGIGGGSTAHADPSSTTLLLNPNIVDAVTGGIFDLTKLDSGITPATAPACTGADAAHVCGLTQFIDLYGTTGTLTAAQVTASGVDLATGQLQKTDFQSQTCSQSIAAAMNCSLVALAFVTNDQPITLSLSTGTFAQDAASTVTCDKVVSDAPAAGGIPPTSHLGGPDCDSNVATVARGVVAAAISGVGSVLGAGTLSVTQAGISVSASYTVVGNPNLITLAATKTSITSPGVSSCTLPSKTNVGGSSSNADQAGLGAKITDANGTALTGMVVTYTTSNATAVKLAVATSISLNLGTTLGNIAPNFACGGTGTGVSTVKASVCLINCGLATELDQSASVDITAVGVPAKIALTAAPSTISCDGVNSSTVTALVTDASGNNVADGTVVTFSVVALGTANPIQTTTKAGSATSVVTPLSVSTAGTTVIVTAGPIQASTRVDCALPVPTVAPVASATPRGGIGGPDTGTGGYLNQSNASGFPMWTLIALMLGSVTLVAGGLVTRRAGK